MDTKNFAERILAQNEEAKRQKDAAVSAAIQKRAEHDEISNAMANSWPVEFDRFRSELAAIINRENAKLPQELQMICSGIGPQQGYVKRGNNWIAYRIEGSTSPERMYLQVFNYRKGRPVPSVLRNDDDPDHEIALNLAKSPDGYTIGWFGGKNFDQQLQVSAMANHVIDMLVEQPLVDEPGGWAL